MQWWNLTGVVALFLVAASPEQAPDYAGDAAALDRLIAENYAYLDRLPDGKLPDSKVFEDERAAVHDGRTLLAYAEHRLATLADHHAITGSSFSDSWAVVPTYADLWIVAEDGAFKIDAVRADSPAEKAGLKAGDMLVQVSGHDIKDAIWSFWHEIGVQPVGDEWAAYTARVLAAGRRDRDRNLTISRDGVSREVTLPNLYAVQRPQLPPISTSTDPRGVVTVRFNNALGDNATIKAFDAVMMALPAQARVIIDLRDTPSGGNSTVARGVMGWFVDRPTPYQIHNLPAELRSTGIARQWIEEVLPRPGQHRAMPLAVRVGRWTGSMGEGIAIGFSAMNVPVCGDRMAGLLGAVYDFDLPSSGLRVKFPAERLYSVSGQPREDFVPISEQDCPI